MQFQVMITTTVVGSYPMRIGFLPIPSQQALEDATMVVLKTQELAEIDVMPMVNCIALTSPSRNECMIEYFVRPLGNVRREITRADVASLWKAKKGWASGFDLPPS